MNILLRPKSLIEDRLMKMECSVAYTINLGVLVLSRICRFWVIFWRFWTNVALHTFWSGSKLEALVHTLKLHPQVSTNVVDSK